MIRTLYFSTAMPEIKQPEVHAIVTHAATANAKRNITGALAFNGRNFCQCLEGEEDAVRDLLKIIEKDPRHSGFKVIDEKPITERHFANWTMHQVDGLDFSTVVNAMNA